MEKKSFYKKGFLKAVNMFTGNRTSIPVSSPHYVTCANCSHDDTNGFSPCRYCKGCLDCRDTYHKPLVFTLTFSQLLDRFHSYELLPF